MSLLSLSWTTLAALFAGLSLPLIALYLLKERRPVALVPFAELWLKVARTQSARQPSLRFRRVRSLLWQLAMLAGLLVALANPSFDGWTGHPRRYIAVIDASASMLAPSSDPQRWDTRLDEALSQARDEASALGARDRGALIIAGPTLRVAQSLGPVHEVADATRAPIVAAGAGSLKEAISLAKAMTAPSQAESWLRVWSDEEPREALRAAWDGCTGASTTCTWTRVGGAAPNPAITVFAARRSLRNPALVDLSAEVHNFGDRPITLTLHVASAGIRLREISIELAPNDHERVNLHGVDAPGDHFTASIHPPEGSPSLPGVAYDDIAFAVVGPRARLRIARVGDRPNLFLDAVLLALDAEIELVSMSQAQARRAPDQLESFDLVVIDASDDPAPLVLPNTTALFFDPYAAPERSFPVGRIRSIRRPRLSTRPVDHPLVKGIVFKDVNIATATSFAIGEGDRALLKHFDEPIAVTRATEYGEWIVIGFDPIRSDLPLRVAFPMLLSRVVERLSPPAAGVAPRLEAGRRMAIHMRDLDLQLRDGAAITIVDEDRRPITRATAVGDTVEVTLPAPGIYQIVDAGRTLGRLAVMGHGRAESELRPAVDATTIDTAEDAEDGRSQAPWTAIRWPPFAFLLMLVFASLMLESRWFHQRRTV